MKKKYFLIIGAIFLLFLGESFVLSNPKEVNKQDIISVDKNDFNFQEEFDKYDSQKNSTVKVKKDKNPVSQELTYSEIEIYNGQKQITGNINLFADNPYLQHQQGNKEIKPFQVNNSELGFFEIHLDRNIAYQTTSNDKIPNFIGITYTAKSSDFNYSSSVIKAYNQFGDIIFNSGVLYSKNYINPSISPNGKYLAVYSSIYEDEAENYRLIDENKVDFFDLHMNTKIHLKNKNLNLDLPHGSFDENNLFITTKGYAVSIIDIVTSSFYLGLRDEGQHIKAVRSNEGIKIYSINNLNKNSIKDVTNKFQKHSL